MKRILILGSEGFIGKYLIEYYLSRNFFVFGCDVFEAPTNKYNYFKVSRLSPELEDVFSLGNYDICINAAGSGNVTYSVTHPVSDFEANSLDTIRILDNIRRFCSTCCYMHISSAAVYGNPLKLPVSEEDPLQPLSPYGWHKLIAENICKEYSTVFGIKIITVRPFSIYGPGLKKQLFWDLYQKCLNSKDIVDLWGTGNESRDFIYITDLVNCLDLLIKSAEVNAEPYNIASGIEVNIKDVVKLFLDSINLDVKHIFNQQVRKGDPLNWRADVSRIKKLGFQPETSIKKGIELTSLWMKNQN